MTLHKQASVEITLDDGHGRIEKRLCRATDQLLFLDGKEEWFGLQSIAKFFSQRTDKQSEKQS